MTPALDLDFRCSALLARRLDSRFRLSMPLYGKITAQDPHNDDSSEDAPRNSGRNLRSEQRTLSDVGQRCLETQATCFRQGGNWKILNP